MSRLKHTPVELASPDEIEQQFYETMRLGDVEKMMALWSDDDDIACVHPGGGRLIGPTAVRASFRQMFANGRGVDITAEEVHRVQGHSSAVHSVVERITMKSAQGEQSGWLNATNVYARTTLGWRLVAHHSSAAPEHEGSGAAEPGTVLH